MSIRITDKIVGTIARSLDSAVAANEPGVAVGVSHRGRVIHTAARGLANLETETAFTPDTPFRICSISKQFVCSLIWREVQAGRIALHDHPGKFVSWARVLDPAITIRHLMQNQSGIRDQWVMAMMMGARAEQRFTLEDGSEVMRRAHQSMFTPGAQNWYCNGNFEILGQVLEVVSGRSFTENVDQHVFAPLGMMSSTVGVDTALAIPGDARGYRFHEGVWQEEENRIHWAGSAGIVSTIHDLLKWEACLRDPAASGLDWVARIKKATPFNDGTPVPYACGITHLGMHGRTVLTHSGALRGWRSILMRFDTEDVGIAVFMNRTNSPQGRLPRTLMFEIAAALGIKPVWDAGVKRFAAPASRLAAGWFHSSDAGMVVEMRHEDGKLAAMVEGQGTPLFQAPAGAKKAARRNLLMSEDTETQLVVHDANRIDIRLTDANLSTTLTRVLSPGGAFAVRGHFHCEPIGTTAIIEVEGDGFSIRFDGIFGEGIRYRLNAIDANLAWFDIPRGVDESPPGQILLRFDQKEDLIELSAATARRVIYRRV